MRLLRCETPLGVFSLLWALAASLHHLEAQPLAGLPLYPFAILLWLFPERLWAIASFAVAHTALLSLDLPAAANHSVLALMVNACLLIGCMQALRSNDPVSRRRRLWESIRGPVQATVAVVYFFAVFHKLNSSFFDADVSCATSQVAKLFDLHGFPASPTTMSMFSFTSYLTGIVEAAIVVCLLWPRLSYVGARLGLLFHTGLGWAQFFDFATVVFALYLLFLPWEGMQRHIDRLPRWTGACFVSCLIAVCTTSFYFHGNRRSPVIFAWPQWNLQADTLICLFWTLMVWPILWPIFYRGDMQRGDRRGGSGAMCVEWWHFHLCYVQAPAWHRRPASQRTPTGALPAVRQRRRAGGGHGPPGRLRLPGLPPARRLRPCCVAAGAAPAGRDGPTPPRDP